jgi:hypothetical protein
MADNSPASSVAAVAIVLMMLAVLVGGYMMFGHGGDKNDIHISIPGDGHRN